MTTVSVFGAESSATATPAEPGKPESVSTATRGMDSAKREFEAMKAARDAAQSAGGKLPGIAVPELHVERAGDLRPPLPGKSLKQDPVSKKSSNWLVDAMERDAASHAQKNERSDGGRNSSVRSAGKENAEREGLFPTTESRASRNRVDSAEKRAADEDQERKKTSEPANPLTRYLGDWMTPQDYTVLRPTFEESLGARAAESSTLATPTAGLENFVFPGDSDTVNKLRSGGPKTAGPVVARENPYLEAMQMRPDNAGGIGVFSGPVPAVTAVPPSATMPLATPPPPAPAPRSKIPEFAKPQTDEKYFKQLKRF